MGGSWADPASDCKAACPQQVLKGFNNRGWLPYGRGDTKERRRKETRGEASGGRRRGVDLPAGSTQVRRHPALHLRTQPSPQTLAPRGHATVNLARKRGLLKSCFNCPHRAGAAPSTQAGPKAVLRMRSSGSLLLVAFHLVFCPSVFFLRHLEEDKKMTIS